MFREILVMFIMLKNKIDLQLAELLKICGCFPILHIELTFVWVVCLFCCAWIIMASQKINKFPLVAKVGHKCCSAVFCYVC